MTKELKAVNPKAGELVRVRHTTVYDKNGNPSITASRKVIDSVVKYIYGDGRVQVSSGDVWDVVRLDDGRLATGLK